MKWSSGGKWKTKKIEERQTNRISFRRDHKPGNEKLYEVITSQVLKWSKAIKLASLNIHLHISDIMPTKSDAETEQYFVQYAGRKFVNDILRRAAKDLSCASESF